MREARIIYDDEDRTIIKVICVQDYEADEQPLASKEVFSEDDEGDAWEYCYKLADKHKLKVNDTRPARDQKKFYLD